MNDEELKERWKNQGIKYGLSGEDLKGYIYLESIKDAIQKVDENDKKYQFKLWIFELFILPLINFLRICRLISNNTATSLMSLFEPHSLMDEVMFTSKKRDRKAG